MYTMTELERAADLFKVLGNTSRLRILHELTEREHTVGALAEKTGMSQPLVSQHLRTLRAAGIVSSQRIGKEVHYELADAHVLHVLVDAIVHANEGSPHAAGPEERKHHG